MVALERTGNRDATIAGYNAALERWPDNLPAAIGLANQHHERGAFLEAALVLRKALLRHPKSTVVMNNLAQTLSDQGRNGEALLQVDAALELHGPFESEVLATRQLILGRVAQQTAGNEFGRKGGSFNAQTGKEIITAGLSRSMRLDTGSQV